jgi:hypothetical protein
LSLISVMLV